LRIGREDCGEGGETHPRDGNGEDDSQRDDARPTGSFGGDSSCALAVESRGEERGNGEGKEARGSAHLLSKREGEKRGSWARVGDDSAVESREKRGERAGGSWRRRC